MTVMPFDTLLMNITEIVNEMTVLIVAYLLMCFSDFITSPHRETDVGWALIILILVNILFNIVVLLYVVIRKAILYFRRYQARKAAMNRAAQIKQEKEATALKLKAPGSKYI